MESDWYSNRFSMILSLSLLTHVLQYIVVVHILFPRLALLSLVISLHYIPTVQIPYNHVIWLRNAAQSHKTARLPRRKAKYLSVKDSCVQRLETSIGIYSPLERDKQRFHANELFHFWVFRNSNRSSSNTLHNAQYIHNTQYTTTGTNCAHERPGVTVFQQSPCMLTAARALTFCAFVNLLDIVAHDCTIMATESKAIIDFTARRGQKHAYMQLRKKQLNSSITLLFYCAYNFL